GLIVPPGPTAPHPVRGHLLSWTSSGCPPTRGAAPRPRQTRSPVVFKSFLCSRRSRLAIPAAVTAAILVLLVPGVALAEEEKTVFTSFMDRWGLLGGALGAFIGGVGASLMPCTYPMIAITVSVFGAREAKSRTEAMLLSTVFVLGLVSLFTPMLVGAALTGNV